MCGLFKKKENNGPPDIGKEEIEENAGNDMDGFDGAHYPEAKSKSKTNRSKKSVESDSDEPSYFLSQTKQSQNSQKPQSSQSPSYDRTSFDLEKINARLEMINSLIAGFNERFSGINQQVGEIRAMAIANEKNLSISNLDARKVVDVVKEVDPEKLRLEYQRLDFKIGGFVSKLDSYKQYMDSIMEELKELKRKANLFEGTDAILKLDQDVKKDLIQIQKVNSRVRMNADKSEQIFIELSKGLHENQKLNEMIINLDESYSGLKKEIERLTLDYSKIMSLDDFDEFKKKIMGKFIILENSLSEVEKMREEHGKLSKAIGKILLMEKRNEEDIANVGLNKGNADMKKISDYEQKLYAILEITEKMASEISKIKEKIGIKPMSVSAGQEPVRQVQITGEPAGMEINRAGSEFERLKIENENKINSLLVKGRKNISEGDLTMAWKVYKDIYDLYNPVNDANRAVYYRIINYYDTLYDLINKPVVSVKQEEPQSQKFPPLEGRKYKQLSDY